MFLVLLWSLPMSSATDTRFDPFATDVVRDPYPAYAALHAGPRVVHQPRWDMWVLSRHDDVRAALRDHRLSSADGVTFLRAPLPMMLTQDPPDHERLRRIVGREFAPRDIHRFRPDIERFVREGLDEMAASESADLVEHIAMPVPIYTLNWLPIGGFVKLEGEDGDSEDPRSFTRAPLLTKLVVLVAGVGMNLLLALVIMIGIPLYGDDTIGFQIGNIQTGSPADAAGLRGTDVIVSLDGQYQSAFAANQRGLIDALQTRAGETVTLGVERGGGAEESVQVRLRDRAAIEQGLAALGVERLSVVKGDHRITYEPGAAVGLGVERTVNAFGLILDGLGDLGESIINRPTERPPAAGPVGIAVQVSSVFWELGPVATLYLAALLSANLALVNVLPFPPLDGGRMLMLLLKSVAGRRISLRAEQMTYFVGFTFLMAFLLWITWFDITAGAP